MKRRSFLQGLALVPPLLLVGCKKDEPNPPTIFTGYVIDENDKPVEGIGFQFGGKTGGLNGKTTFNINTQTDAKGYYYLEGVIPSDTAGIVFKPIGSFTHPTSSNNNEYRCLVNGLYQEIIPWYPNKKNELNFKIVKR
jgi:hypothetical protein